MKKALSLIMFIGIAMVASSCKKEVTQVIQPNQTILIPVNEQEWLLDDQTYTAEIPLPELDSYEQENAAVLVYISFDDGLNFEQIPEVYDGRAFSFTHSVGFLYIDAQRYNGTTLLENPGDILVKVVIVDSQP
ncbi:MAG: hypothetical protein EOP47_18505 [Sphingobacteriaceae bacterium]|nr:MAG: hypothetical protein EOP47_18505 [Sphingobacteriaceae bacterium]